MRTPPPVLVEASTGLVWPAAQGLLYGASAGTLVAWAGLHLESGVGPTWALAGLAGMLAFVVGLRLSAPVPMRLGWSGAEWLVQTPNEAAQCVAPPAVMLDLGCWMLLRVGRASRRALWVPVSSAAAGAAWSPFRAAVYSSAPGLSPRSASERSPF